MAKQLLAALETERLWVMVSGASRQRNSTFVVGSTAAVSVVTFGFIVPRREWMNDRLAENSSVHTLVAIVFVVSMLVPLAAIRRGASWAQVVIVQVLNAAAACSALFIFTPSGDGLYVLPLGAAAVVALAASVLAALRLRGTDGAKS